MSEAPVSSDSASGAPATQAALPLSRTPEQASQALTEKTQARKLDAERVAGFILDDDVRGPDGKFLPKTAKKTSSDSDTSKESDKRPPAEKKPVEAKAEETPQVKKLEADFKALETKHKEASAKNAEWEQVAEQVIARLDAHKARIAYLEGKLAEHGGAVEPNVMENMTLKEQLRVRELADERAKFAEEQEKQKVEEEAAQQKKVAERHELRTTFATVLTVHPELLPDPVTKFQNKPEAGKFWKDIMDEIAAGRDSVSELAPRLAVAPYIAQAIKAKSAAPVIKEAPRTLSSVRSPGGEPKAVDRFSIVEKHKARLRAG